MSRPVRLPAFVFAIASGLLLAGCGGNGVPAPGGMPPTRVATVTLTPEPAAVVNELPGRLAATRVAEVRARVPGIVLERVFTEGSEVAAGDVLFRIDPQPLQAELANARAALARAEADVERHAAQLARYQRLMRIDAVSRQDYELAVATERQARAEVAGARARVEQARIRLGYAEVRAPIDGRVGRAQVTEGALVGQNEPTPLALIQQLDPMYADFAQSTAELAQLRRAFDDGRLRRVDDAAAEVELVLDDGRVYPHRGRLLFTDVSVDPGTGQVALRAEFPNPELQLLPGTYVRVRIAQGFADDALLVPQQAVQRNPGGQAFVSVVETARVNDGAPLAGPHGMPMQTAAVRVVELGTRLGQRVIVVDGLAPGDEVIVEGFQRALPGAPVIAEPWQPAVPATAAR